MQSLAVLFIAALIFAVCFAVDKAFNKLFRNKAQHMSGMAVRASKRYGLFGVILTALGVMAVVGGLQGDRVLLYGGIVVLLLGLYLAVYYLSFGIFYDGETMLICKFGRKSVEKSFADIVEQHLYVVTGGNLVIELNMADGTAVSLVSSMQGVLPFLDTAFAAWCMAKKVSPESCTFHDPSKSWWFPHEEVEEEG